MDHSFDSWNDERPIALLMAGKHRKKGGKAGIAAQTIKAHTSTTDQSKG